MRQVKERRKLVVKLCIVMDFVRYRRGDSAIISLHMNSGESIVSIETLPLVVRCSRACYKNCG